jgi:hypothetical protein
LQVIAYEYKVIRAGIFRVHLLTMAYSTVKQVAQANNLFSRPDRISDGTAHAAGINASAIAVSGPYTPTQALQEVHHQTSPAA